MRDLLIVLYSRPGLIPITGMTLAGVMIIGWDLVKLAAGRWARTAVARHGRWPRAARASWPMAAATRVRVAWVRPDDILTSVERFCHRIGPETI